MVAYLSVTFQVVFMYIYGIRCLSEMLMKNYTVYMSLRWLQQTQVIERGVAMAATFALHPPLVENSANFPG